MDIDIPTISSEPQANNLIMDQYKNLSMLVKNGHQLGPTLRIPYLSQDLEITSQLHGQEVIIVQCTCEDAPLNYYLPISGSNYDFGCDLTSRSDCELKATIFYPDYKISFTS